MGSMEVYCMRVNKGISERDAMFLVFYQNYFLGSDYPHTNGQMIKLSK